uniref:RING-type E3 ubiquitin transferase n=1 Tax=Anthurium amnicola TaxID=1678845 RepID=A0A1D1Z5E9_9ARAE
MEGHGDVAQPEFMEETAKMENHLSSAAAFVEGGIQEACDDACSICLEAFCDSDPSTVTGCKHEFHLQCILEWCQRSSQCPMCWQPISLKDPTSQELLEAVERERSFRFNHPRNTTIFHHPTLGDFELQHLPVGTSDAELEERIIQHLAAAAAMGGRARHIARREGHRRSGAQGRPQFLVFSAHQSAPSVGPVSDSDQGGENYPRPDNALSGSSIPLTAGGEAALHQVPYVLSSEIQDPISPQSDVTSARSGHSNNRNSSGQSTPVNDRGGPSDFQSFSDSLKSRFNAVSMRCKESITKSTRGWKDRFFSRNSSVADLGSEVRREVQAGIATVSRIMERLDTRENNGTSSTLSQSVEEHSCIEPMSLRIAVGQSEGTSSSTNPSASCTASSGSN